MNLDKRVKAGKKRIFAKMSKAVPTSSSNERYAQDVSTVEELDNHMCMYVCTYTISYQRLPHPGPKYLRSRKRTASQL